MTLPGFIGTVNGQITTSAALPASAPTMDNDDYTGLFVQMGEQTSDANTEGIGSCDFIETSDSAVAYDVHLIDKIEGDSRREDTTLFAHEGNETIPEAERFVINSQQTCGDSEEFVSVELEEISASGVGTPANPEAGEQVTPGVDPEGETDTETTATETPGFGLGIAAVGLGTAVLALRRALRS